MTLRIESQDVPNFAEMLKAHVDAHLAVLREHDAHMVKVRDTAHLPDDDLTKAQEYAPVQPELAIAAAVKCTPNGDGTHTFEPDYEIVPPPLAHRKAKLFDQVSIAERAAIDAVVPSGKIRAFQFRETDIRRADQLRYASAMADAGPAAQVDFAKFTDEHRPADDTHFLEEQAAREDERQEIYRWAADLHSDIEDLTEATIGAWQMKPFHG